MNFREGSVRHRTLVASAMMFLLVAAVAVMVFYRGGLAPSRPTHLPTAALAPGNADIVNRQPAGASPAPQPPRVVPPSFDIVKVGPTGTAVIAGRAEPGSKVTVRDGDQVIGEVTADSRGEWVLVPQQPIAPGDRLLSLEATTEKGGAPIKSEQTVALSVTPAAPGGNEKTALAVLLPRAGAAKVLQRPENSSAPVTASGKPAVLSMDTVEYDEQGQVLLSGHAKPGAKVRIYIGNELVGTATADAAGGWSAMMTRQVDPQRAELRLDQLAEDGHVVQRLTVPLAHVVAANPAPGETYIVQTGNSLWQIARRTYGSGMRYVIIYAANLGQIRDPERIYPGQVFKLPKS
jgi:nucleoid-associated protein YgaU